MIPMNFNKTLNAFAQPVNVTDKIGSRAKGVWQETEQETRQIRGIILAMTIEQVQFLTEGSSSSGGITVTTNETLYFSDINNDGLQSRQSYVDYGGYRYKVIGTGLMDRNTLHNIYNCIRFTE